MASQIPLFAFVTALSLFGLTSLWAARSVTTSDDLFKAHSRSGTVVSMIAANVTLGTGLAYYIGLLNTGWVPAVLVPLGVILGYSVLSAVVSRVRYSPEEDENLLYITQRREDKRQSILGLFLLFLLPIVFMFIVSAEIYISSPIIAQSLALSPTPDTIHGIAIGLGIAGALYAIMGGIRGVVVSDWFQLLFAVLMLGALLVASMLPEVLVGGDGQDLTIASGTEPIRPGIDLNWTSISIALMALLGAIATQFYNIVNMGMGSNFEAPTASKIFLRTGFYLAAVLTAVLLVGAALPQSGPEHSTSLTAVTSSLIANENIQSQFVAFLLVLGIMGVLFSTVDSVILLSTKFLLDRFQTKESQLNLATWKARLAIAAISALSILMFLVLFRFQPETLPLLFTATLPLTLFAPIIVSGFLGNIYSYTPFNVRGRNPYFLLAFIILAWAASLYATLTGNNQVVTDIGIFGTVGLSLLAAFDWAKHRRKTTKASI